MPENLIESILFGHEKGSFTGATERHIGKLVEASGGTLFLDEVGEMSPRVQVMLLRVLQEGTLRRVGGERPIEVDVRVIAATHRDLRQMIARGELREDLYYRLSGTTLRIPPLRERQGDLERLVASVLDELAGPRPWPTPAAWRCLQRYRWPGNVRQLRAEVVRWTVFCEREVRVEDLSPELREAAFDDAPSEASEPTHPKAERSTVPHERGPTSDDRTLARAVDELETRMIRDALAREGSLMGAARSLAIDRNTLKRKLRSLGLR
jgi:DNA-binding NtrC family response regulator